MKVLLVSSAALLSAIGAFILVWQLFGGSYRKEAQIELPCNVVQTQQQKVQVWDSLWLDQVGSRNKTNIGWTFTISRRYYDPEYRELLLGRKWKATAVAQQRKKGDKASRDFDGMREKRASSIVTYFCIFVLVLSLIRAALDMNSNLKKVCQGEVLLIIPTYFSFSRHVLPALFASHISILLPGNNSTISSTDESSTGTNSNATSATAAVSVASTVISSS